MENAGMKTAPNRSDPIRGSAELNGAPAQVLANWSHEGGLPHRLTYKVALPEGVYAVQIRAHGLDDHGDAEPLTREYRRVTGRVYETTINQVWPEVAERSGQAHRATKPIERTA
jgi:hypothetical protein